MQVLSIRPPPQLIGVGFVSRFGFTNDPKYCQSVWRVSNKCWLRDGVIAISVASRLVAIYYGEKQDKSSEVDGTDLEKSSESVSDDELNVSGESTETQ